MKYIVYHQEPNSIVEIMIVFPGFIEHAKMAQELCCHKIISAGQINFGYYSNNKFAYCFGESISLNVKSREDVDTELFELLSNIN